MRLGSIYTIELVAPDGTVLAELSGKAKNRTFTITRNAADDIDWYIDIDQLEDYCRSNGVQIQDPKLLLITNQTEVRVKRYGTYLAAGQLTYKDGVLQETGDGNLLEVKAAGFLNLWTFRYTNASQIYTAEDMSQIAWNLIDSSQQGLNDPSGTIDPTTGLIVPGSATSGIPTADWDFGITQGTLATIGPYDRTYASMAISDALTDFCNVPGGFDMEITYDKKFNTYAQMGVQRPDIVLEYPGNMIVGEMTEDGTQVGNYVTAQGAGNGDATQDVAYSVNAGSTSNYKVRQLFVQPSSLDSTDESLQDYSDWNLAQYQVPFNLPSITWNTANGPAPTDFNLGDWVRVKIRNHPLYSDVDGFYRAEQLQVVVDDDDNELVTMMTSLT